MSAESQLAVVPPKETALQVFQQPNGLEPYLQQIRAEIDSFVPDTTTRKGREAIASIAHKVARSKTALDNVGKELVAELKEIPKLIDAERKRVRDTLDAWKDEVRKPLTDWEQAEADRTARHTDAVNGIKALAVIMNGATAVDLADRIAQLEHLQVGADWEEFETEAARAKDAALAALRHALAARKQHEAEQAELAELRRKQALQEQRDREARIAQEAADRARLEAEQRAQAEREAAAKRESDALAAAEQSRLRAEQAEQRRIAAEQQAEHDRLAAVERERIAAVQAEQRRAQAAEQAAAAERQRQADEQAHIEREARAREADIAHKKTVNNDALAAFIVGGMTEECAKQAITLIAQRRIPNISINY